MNTELITEIIYKALRDAGYACEQNCGTVYIDGPDGKTYWIQPLECEADDDDGDEKLHCCKCGKELEEGEYDYTEDGRMICKECKKVEDEELEKVMGNLADARM